MTMRDLSELKINEGGLPVARPFPSQQLVDAFESRLGLKLPEAYVRLLQHSNGGHPELDTIAPAGIGDARRWSVNRFYHLDDDRLSASSLWAATERWRPILGDHAVPFANDGGGNQFFLCMTTSPPTVKVCVHDDGFAVSDVAPSFEEFVDALRVDPDMV